mmetsp:Transcript_24126/g.50159  ORF Transcript_24126/g.50159 Transcript_24126/m.50159 type:complete len:234 (+) Transcript_24126:440-1141(+)
MKLTRAGVQHDLDLFDFGVKQKGLDGTATLHVLGLDFGVVGHGVADIGQGTTGVVGRRLEGHFVLSSVEDFNGGLLVTSGQQELDGTLEAVFTVGLELHGGPVGADPQVGFHVSRATVTLDGNLDHFLVNVGELPGLSGLTFDAGHRLGDLVQIPAAIIRRRGRAQHGLRGLRREGVDTCGKESSKSENKLHGGESGMQRGKGYGIFVVKSRRNEQRLVGRGRSIKALWNGIQ